MSVRVVTPQIAEAMVPVKRSQGLHYGRGSETLGEFFILHSKDCLASGIDLTTCPYSVALAAMGPVVSRGVFEPDHIYLLRIEQDRMLDGTKGIQVTEQAPQEILDAILDSQGACLQGIEGHSFCDCPPIDYGALAQRAAEDHIIGCWEALHGDREDDPAIGAFCGCTTCEVREILMVAAPILEKAWEAEHD